LIPYFTLHRYHIIATTTAAHPALHHMCTFNSSVAFLLTMQSNDKKQLASDDVFTSTDVRQRPMRSTVGTTQTRSKQDKTEYANALAAAVKDEHQGTFTPPSNTRETRGTKLRCLSFGPGRKEALPNDFVYKKYSVVETYHE
jgi:hypothetical protein